MFWVYVIQSASRRFTGRVFGGPYHVGMTTDPATTLLRHNCEMRGGSSFFHSLRPWKPKALYGPFSEDEAREVVGEVKKLKRSRRAEWDEKGRFHPWVGDPTLRPQQF